MSENNKNVKENNKSSVYLLIIVFLVIIIGLLVTIVMLLSNDNKVITNNNNEEIVENNKIEVNDTIKLELSNKINRLLSPYKSTTFEQSITFGDYGFRYAVLARPLTDFDKQFIVLNTITYDDIDTGRWQEVPTVKSAIDIDTKYADGYLMKKEYGVLSYDAVNKSYNELFGSDLTNPAESVGKCPYIYYSSTTKEFYKFRPACGGTSGSSVTYYKDKFESTSNDTIDVYVNFGFIKYDEKTTKYYVYGDADIAASSVDFTATITGKNVVTELTEGNQFSYKITDANKDKFSQYKFTFKKKDNYFYFEKVEKVR